MLTISPQTMERYDASARPAFVAWVGETLADKYPHFLPRFPEAVRSRIVGNMLGRAAAWGVGRQRALLAWCELMIIVAANFDEAEPIKQVLERDGAQMDLLIPELPELISEDDWEKSAANGSSLPFFHVPGLAQDSLERRTSDAVRLVLGDRPEAAQPNAAVLQAQKAVASMKLASVPDALLVTVACRSFYGAGPAWLTSLLAERLPARAVVEAMRLRLALDFGRVL